MSEPLRRVLIIDGDPAVRSALARLLRRHDYQVATAVSGRRAFKRLRNGESFDCIILELMMPDIQGREFIQTVREENLFLLKRLLILTCFHNVDNATAYLQYGCGAYCGKPFDNDRILRQIARLVQTEAADGELDALW